MAILADNARAKEVDLSRLDFVVLSHRHSDHMPMKFQADEFRNLFRAGFVASRREVAHLSKGVWPLSPA